MSSGDLPERVTSLESDVAVLAKGYVDLSSQRNPSRVQSFLQETDEEAARILLEDLAGWAAVVWVQWPDGRLPECWLHHPVLIEELWAVMGAHRACFRQGGTWQAFADWHARVRPAAAERIKKLAGTCQLSEHEPGKPFDPAKARTVPRIEDISAVAAQWTTTGTAPCPPLDLANSL